MSRYYLDTNALYAFYRQNMGSLLHHPDNAHYKAMQGGERVRQLAEQGAALFVSRLTCLEFIGSLLRHERGKQLKRRETDLIFQRLDRDLGHVFRLISQTETTMQAAQALMMEHARRGGCALETNDAIHIATAMLMDPPLIMVTSDGGKLRGSNSAKMKCVCERIGLDLLDPEESQA